MQQTILNYFMTEENKGLILSGIVGSGKTTLIRSCLEQLKTQFHLFEFTGDDTVFRVNVQADSKYIYQQIRGITDKRILVFVDEVQKSEDIFDSIKYLFDKGNASFIVSGSNPEYLQTVARKRLQRRADFKILFPFSIPEILATESVLQNQKVFSNLLKGILPKKIPQIEITPKMQASIHRYLLVGGLPLAFLNTEEDQSLQEIQKSFDRGFEPIRSEQQNISDSVAVELAKLHSQEFAYANFINKTRISKREVINSVIQALIDHGYVGTVIPYLFDSSRRTYLKKYFYIDPGLVTFLTGDRTIKNNLGYKIEGLVYSRLSYLLQFELTKNKGIYFYKNYKVTSDGSLRFSKGEVDAVYQAGPNVIPIEIKATSNWRDIDIHPIQNLISKHSLPYGLIVYGGEPRKVENIYFWPYWLI
jgi:predicted AAA+ superfamily ATPase